MTAPTEPLALLRAAPEEIHPALLLAWELKQRELAGTLEIETLLGVAPAIDAAITNAETALRDSVRALKVLRAARPAATSIVPEGF
jgi:hypothetical protein